MSIAPPALSLRLRPWLTALCLGTAVAAFSAPAVARGPDGIADVAEKVIDAVVNISTTQTVEANNKSGDSKNSDTPRGAMPQLPPGVLWFVFSPYNIEFLGGVGVALLYNTKPFHKLVYWFFLLAGTVWLFVGPATDPGNQTSRFILFGLASIAIIFALTGLEGSRQITISNRFTKLGDASYIIYLLHPSALVFVYKYVDDHPSTPFWVYVCISVGLIFVVGKVSIFTHYSLEKPMIVRLNKLVARFSA